MCKDNSCDGGGACFGATIPYVVGPSCTGSGSCTFATNPACFGAQISSAVSSCKDLANW